MNKADMALLVTAPAKGGKSLPPKAGAGKKPAAKESDTLERGYFQQAIEAFRNGDDEAAITAAIKGVRACVEKEQDFGY